MKKLLPPLIIAAIALLTIPQERVSRVALGTHAPKSAAMVWRIATEAGGSASAVPVALKPDDPSVVLFLTARHVARILGDGAIVESPDKQRKLLIVKHVEHPKEDIAVIHVKLTAEDSKPIALVSLGVGLKLELGLSVFSVGYPAPVLHWFVARGYLGPLRWCSAEVFSGMSGGALLTSSGKLIGVLEGYAGDEDNQPTMVWDRPPLMPNAKIVGGFLREHKYNSQSAYTSLALVKPWLIANHVLKE